jgi:hypothetical protein
MARSEQNLASVQRPRLIAMNTSRTNSAARRFRLRFVSGCGGGQIIRKGKLAKPTDF